MTLSQPIVSFFPMGKLRHKTVQWGSWFRLTNWVCGWDGTWNWKQNPRIVLLSSNSSDAWRTEREGLSCVQMSWRDPVYPEVSCLWETLFSAPLTSVAIHDVCMCVCVCLSVFLSFRGHGSIAPRVPNCGSSGQRRPVQCLKFFFFYWLPAFLEKLRNFIWKSLFLSSSIIRRPVRIKLACLQANTCLELNSSCLL